MSLRNSEPRRMTFTSGKRKIVCTYDFFPEDAILESDLDKNAGYQLSKRQIEALGDCVWRFVEKVKRDPKKMEIIKRYSKDKKKAEIEHKPLPNPKDYWIE